MCGIAGFRLAEATRESPLAILKRMTDAIQHRGPNAEGRWFEPRHGVGLGHRRLSIIDLTETGNQPMADASGRFRISFNGEIYNHPELRTELAGRGSQFRGTSDTEVLLASIAAWGLEEAMKRAVGMFAFALWDDETATLTLASDRFGEKPLYYGRIERSLVFASELKALRVFPGWGPAIDRNALALYLRHDYVPAPHAIYQGISKVEPGTYLQFSENGSAKSPVAVRYWDHWNAVELGAVQPLGGDDRDVADQVEASLRRSIRGQMVADVPVGAFLSGGIDSSLVVALMQQQSAESIKTFTIGFHESDYNEAEHARAVAKHLGTDHTDLYVTPSEAMSVVPSLPTLYDEPFADASQVPTALVSRLARTKVTVSLSGDGGDELFGGYWRYVFGARLWRRLKGVPQAVRGMTARAVQSITPASWDRMFSVASRVGGQRFRLGFPGDRIHKLAGILRSGTPEQLYNNLVSHWRAPTAVVLGATEPETALTRVRSWPAGTRFESKMMFLDTVSYLPGDILVKIDRAAMGVSLETRVPFLDHRVYELAWRIPLEQKVRTGKGKWILRQLLGRYLPANLFERPKMGFGIPIEHWPRGPLRAWAEDLMAPDLIRRQAFFDPTPIRRMWDEHLSGTRNWQYHLWDILMFQAWWAAQ